MQGKSTTGEIGKKYFGMLCTLAKRWYLCCYKCWHTNLNVYPNTYSHQSSFLFQGNSRIQFSHVKVNKQSKADILMKLMENPGGWHNFEKRGG